MMVLGSMFAAVSVMLTFLAFCFSLDAKEWRGETRRRGLRFAAGTLAVATLTWAAAAACWGWI